LRKHNPSPWEVYPQHRVLAALGFKLSLEARFVTSFTRSRTRCKSDSTLGLQVGQSLNPAPRPPRLIDPQLPLRVDLPLFERPTRLTPRSPTAPSAIITNVPRAFSLLALWSGWASTSGRQFSSLLRLVAGVHAKAQRHGFRARLLSKARHRRERYFERQEVHSSLFRSCWLAASTPSGMHAVSYSEAESHSFDAVTSARARRRSPHSTRRPRSTARASS